MLKVAIIGCGKIADRHAEQIRLVADCEIVGVCDNEELMAKQLQERLGVPAYFTDVRDLLDKAKPDVAHITTPPQSHYPLGKICLEAGCNVYIEKPFTVELSQAEELIAIAEHRNLKATVQWRRQGRLERRGRSRLNHRTRLHPPGVHGPMPGRRSAHREAVHSGLCLRTTPATEFRRKSAVRFAPAGLRAGLSHRRKRAVAPGRLAAGSLAAARFPRNAAPL